MLWHCCCYRYPRGRGHRNREQRRKEEAEAMKKYVDALRRDDRKQRGIRAQLEVQPHGLFAADRISPVKMAARTAYTGSSKMIPLVDV